MDPSKARSAIDSDHDFELANESEFADTDDDFDPHEFGDPDAGDSTSFVLPSGELLNVEAVDSLLRRRAARLVSIVGERESGKTTLICSLYDRFCSGHFGGLSFAGSTTLVSFERRLHYSRAVSGRAAPDIPRTSISDGLGFFHLALAEEGNPNNRHDLLLSDRAGEIYRQARNISSDLDQLIEIKKAHLVVLLVDGKRLADRVERTAALENARQSLRAFLDNGIIGADSKAQVVVTKFDLVDGHPDNEQIRERLVSFQERMENSFADRIGKLTFSKVAALDPTGRLPLGWGVDDLLRSWLESETHPRTVRVMPSVPLRTEFDLLLSRTKIEAMP